MAFLTVEAYDLSHEFEEEIKRDFNVTVKDRQREPWCVVFEGDRHQLVRMFNFHWSDTLEHPLTPDSPWLSDTYESAIVALDAGKSVPTIEEVLSGPASSTWLKDALRIALARDPVDAANDANLLSALLSARADALLTTHGEDAHLWKSKT